MAKGRISDREKIASSFMISICSSIKDNRKLITPHVQAGAMGHSAIGDVLFY
jgi:hypothetical protein